MLTSILKPSSGSARVAGFDVVREPGQVRHSVGVLTENHGLYMRMRSEEYLGFFGELYGLSPAQCRARVAELLDQFGMRDAVGKRLGEYSKGMRQKLALIRAMLHNPPVLLLDEPTSAMDPQSARLVRDDFGSDRAWSRPHAATGRRLRTLCRSIRRLRAALGDGTECGGRRRRWRLRG